MIRLCIPENIYEGRPSSRPLEGLPRFTSCCQNSPFKLVHSDFHFPFPGRQVASYQSFWNVCGLGWACFPISALPPGVGSLGLPWVGRAPGGECALAFSHPLTFLFYIFHSLRLPSRGRCWQNLQPNHWPVSLQGRCDRNHLQPLCQRLPAEPLSHRPLHKYVPGTLFLEAPAWVWVLGGRFQLTDIQWA